MIFVKQMFHTCPESESLLRTIEWDRGKWKYGIQIIVRCPCCKEILPLSNELNQIHTEVTSWQGKFHHKYDLPILSIKPIIRRKKRAKYKEKLPTCPAVASVSIPF